MFRKFYASKTDTVQHAAFLLAFSAILAMFLGFLRDKLLAHHIGPSQILDVYYSAFRIPDILFNTVATLFSVSILMPILSSYIHKDSEVAGQRFIKNITISFFAIMAVVCLVAYFMFPLLSRGLVANFSPEMTALYIKIGRTLLISQVVILGLSNLFATVTEYYRHFLIWSFVPIVYNLGIIIGILFYPQFGILAVVWGVFLGALLHLSLQLPIIKKYGYLNFRPFKRILADYNFGQTKSVIKTALPRVMSLSLNNLIMLILIAVAARLSVGSVSVFSFAYTIQSVPMSILGLAFSVAAFASLSKSYNEGNMQMFKHDFVQSARKVFALTLIISIVFLVFRFPLVDFLLGSGAFTDYHTLRVACLILVGFIGIVPAGIVQLYLRTLYATGDTKRPFWATVITAVVTICVTIFGLWLFRHAHISEFVSYLTGLYVDDTFVLVLTFAVSFSSIINALFLRHIMRKNMGIKGVIDKDLVYKTLFVSITANAVSYLFYLIIMGWFGGANLANYLIFIVTMLVNMFITFWLAKRFNLVEVYEYMQMYLSKFGLSATKVK